MFILRDYKGRFMSAEYEGTHLLIPNIMVDTFRPLMFKTKEDAQAFMRKHGYSEKDYRITVYAPSTQDNEQDSLIKTPKDRLFVFR